MREWFDLNNDGKIAVWGNLSKPVKKTLKVWIAEHNAIKPHQEFVDELEEKNA